MEDSKNGGWEDRNTS